MRTIQSVASQLFTSVHLTGIKSMLYNSHHYLVPELLSSRQRLRSNHYFVCLFVCLLSTRDLCMCDCIVPSGMFCSPFNFRLREKRRANKAPLHSLWDSPQFHAWCSCVVLGIQTPVLMHGEVHLLLSELPPGPVVYSSMIYILLVVFSISPFENVSYETPEIILRVSCL